MIYTLTLNPTVDYFLNINSFKEGDLNLAEHTAISSGGKGINVSIVLSNLQVRTTAFGFSGGFVGEQITTTLSQSSIINKFIKIKDNTRINIKLYNEQTNTETEIAGVSPNITKEQEDALLNEIYNTVKSGDILVLAGSIPNSISKNIYQKISQKLPSNVKIVLDTRGDSLKNNIHSYFLIKPNRKEIEEIFKKSLPTHNDIIDACDYFFDQNIENIIVSLGHEGSLYLNKNHIYHALPIKLNVKSAVGAGDSMVAGFIYGLSLNESLENCYKFAVASSCGTITSNGLTSKEAVDAFYKQVIIQQLK